MSTTRTKTWLILFVLTVGIFLILQRHPFDNPHTGTVGVGVLMICLAVWEAARGKSSLLFRTVRKSDAPVLFWSGVFLTAAVGAICLVLSFV